jgi:hypothetical protein
MFEWNHNPWCFFLLIRRDVFYSRFTPRDALHPTAPGMSKNQVFSLARTPKERQNLQ